MGKKAREVEPGERLREIRSEEEGVNPGLTFCSTELNPESENDRK